MFDAPRRPLVFPLKNPMATETETPGGLPECQVPVFPEDSDEQITVLFRLSLNEFVALASAIDVGSDIAYGADSLKIWWLWNYAYMCAQFCEEMAQCFTDQNEALMTALAAAIASNAVLQAAIASVMPEIGSAVPGRPLTAEQAGQSFLPPDVKDEFGDCIDNALWGACLFLVQSGNRAITDFFEQTEAATNALETSAIVVQNVPAAGGYAASALEFADQIQETLAEGYAGAYTEAYENGLACDLFCLARAECTLTADMLIFVMEQRLGYIDGTENFGVLMARIGTGVFVGGAIADSAFYIYFSALKFGQQFGDILGFRPLTDLMSLGADQLASNNWEVLCDCGTAWEYIATLTELEFWDDYAFADTGVWSPGNGWGASGLTYNGQAIFGIATSAPFFCLTAAVKITTPMTGDQNGVIVGSLDLSVAVLDIMGTETEWEVPVNDDLNGIAIGYAPNDTGSGYPDFPGYTFEVTVRGIGYQPPELGG